MRILYIGKQAVATELKQYKWISTLHVVKSVDEALLLLDNKNNYIKDTNFDTILLDNTQPNKHLVASIKEINYINKGHFTPIIVLINEETASLLENIYHAGANDYITWPINETKLLFRMKALRPKMGTDGITKEKELINVIHQLKDSNQKLKKLTYLDGLTGIYNRRFFDSYINEAWKMAAEQTKSLSIIMVDIDDFKAFNDTYGHQKGDDCLRQVGMSLKQTADKLNGLVARYGGEEFVVVLMGYNDDIVLNLTEELRLNVEQLGIPHDHSPVGNHVTVSLGVSSIIPNESHHVDSLLNVADQALYKAKNMGRNGSFSKQIS
jgi:two-component system chemotaxis family response regulator WspR